MVLLNSLIWSFYPFSSLLFLFGKKKEETTQAATQGIPVPQQNIPTPGNIPAAKAEEKPIFRIEQPTIPALPDVKDPATFSIKYPLIPPYTFARIRWDSAATELVYEIEEPVLTDNEKQVLDTLEDGIKELINLSFISVKDRDTVLIYLEKNIRVLLAELSIELSTESFLKIMYYIYRDFVGLNELEPLMNDYFIEDIECNGLNSPVYLVHRKYRNIRTNLVYKDIHKMAAFVEKIAQKCGRYISYAEPLLDGSLPDGSRIQAVYSTDVASKGPSFCIVDGYIQLNNGEVKKIDKLFEESKKIFGFKVEDKNEIVEVINLKCCGVNEKDLSQNDSKIKTIIKLSPPKKLVEVKLEDGTEIITTTNHLFHVADDELKLIEAKKLIQGMFIPIPNKIHVEGCNQSINIHNLLKEFSYNYKICAISNTRIKELVNQEIFNYTNINEHNKYRQNISKEYGVGSTYFYEIISRGNSISFEVLEKICGTRNVNLNEIENLQIVVYGGGGKNASKVISIPCQVDEDLAYLVGAIISDGHLGENHIDVAAYESGFNDAVYTKLIKLFGKSQKYYDGNRIYLCNILASFYFNKIFGIPYGKKARIVSVPEIIFRSNNKVVASFLKGLFDGDGTCFGGLSYKTYSKCLANEISYLLTRFGVYSYIKTNGEENKIVIPSIYEKDYYEKIGFENKIKKVQLEKLLRRKDKLYKTYIRHGRIPAKPVLNLLKKLGISKNYISKKCDVSYSRLVHYDSLSKPFVNDIIKLIEEKDIKNNKVDYVRWLANSEQEFVKIKNIKIFDNFENKSVYDVEIEPCKFFIGGNRPMNLFDTVRRFTKEPWSPLQLIIKGTCTSEIYAYIWMAVEYENSLMIVGGTGSGKCVSGDTPIHLANGKKKNIKDLIEEKFRSNKIKKNGDWEYTEGDGTEILSMNILNFKVEKVRIEKLWRHKSPQLLIKIITESERKIICTPEHLFFINEGTTIYKKRADNILLGDKIAYPKYVLTNSEILFDEIKSIDYLLEHNEEYVYDLTVPINHNFLAGEIPIIVHNTSFVNTVAFFIPPQARVVSIEDTKEIQLEHENWLPSVARAGAGLTNLVGQKYGEVSLFDLLKASFRQRPDYIIVGEVRGQEAFVLFQAFASIRGDEEIFVLYEDKPLRVKIKDLENYDINKLKTISYNVKENKCEILPVKGWIKHPKRNTLYKITTKTGREITITQDHSLFTYENEKVKEIKGEDLVIGSNIVIPLYIECGYSNIAKINLLEYLPDLRIYAPEYVKEASHKLGYYQANILVGSKSITDYYSEGIMSKPNAMKAETFTKLMREANVNYNIENLKVKFNGMSEKSSVFLDLSDEFLRLLGYYISEGSLNTSGRNYRIEFYNSDKKILEDMEKCIIKVSNKKPKKRITDRGWGSATELSFNHKILYELIKRYCGTKFDKRIPDFIYGLDKKRIGIFLSALYDGDGAVMDKGIGYYTTSKKLANDVAQLLLVYGIVATISKRNREGRKTTDYEINFYANYKKEEFLKYVKPISKTCKIIEGVEDKKLLNHLYCDTVKEIEVLHLDEPEYVYDIAVPGNENFIGGFGSVLLHNSGHPGMATMHAESVETMVKRLETAPINLSGSLIETLAAVIVMTQSKIKGKEVRKVSSVDEIIEVKEHEGGTKTNTVFKWDPKTDKFTFNPNSKVFENISTHFGFTKEQVLNEFNIRVKLIKELFRRGIVGFKDVQKIIHEYYKAPETVLKRYGIK